MKHLSRSEEPNYDSGFVFYEVVKLQHRGAYLERTERPQVQVLGVDTRDTEGFRKLPKQSGSTGRVRRTVEGVKGKGALVATFGVRKQPKCLQLNTRENALAQSPEARLFPEIVAGAGNWLV